MTDSELPEALARIEELERLHARTRERAVDLEEEKQLLEKQIEGYALGLKAFAANPKLGGMVPAPAVAEELMRIIGRDPAIARDKAMKGQLSDKWRELTLIAAGHDKVSLAEEPLPSMAGDLPALLFTGPHRLPVPAAVRRQGGLGPVIIAAEYVANQWDMGNVPSEESLNTLCKAMKLYSRLSVSIAADVTRAPAAIEAMHAAVDADEHPFDRIENEQDP